MSWSTFAKVIVTITFASATGVMFGCAGDAAGGDQGDESGVTAIEAPISVCGSIWRARPIAGGTGVGYSNYYSVAPSSCPIKNASGSYVDGAWQAINSAYWNGYAVAQNAAYAEGAAKCPIACPANVTFLSHYPASVESVPPSAVFLAGVRDSAPGPYRCEYDASVIAQPTFQIECMTKRDAGTDSGS